MLAQRLSLGVIPLVILVAATASSPIAQDQPPVAPEETNAPTGRISHVTVYRGQALVSRAIDVPAGRGPSEIVVGELPAYVIPGSLYADGADGVAVRAVRYRTRVTGTDQREEVQAVHEAIEELDQRAMENSALMTLIASQLSYLDKLESFVAPAAMSEMAHGVLNA
ncbi:MAG: DUF4140 domain-containing protein, partial [Planctomycetes bacterium]|nr:DUF4140 domain-containing protein [Planctomycetota bacterium]